MRASTKVRRIMRRCGKKIHAARSRNVLQAVDALTTGGRASLTQIGRAVARPIAPKYRIKWGDRLVGNVALNIERATWFGAVAAELTKGDPAPIILLDWTELSHDWYALIAAVPVQRRAIPIYCSVHPKSRRGGNRIIGTFLRTVRSLLAADCSPIFVADAGFTKPFMRACIHLGCDWVIRLRGNGTLRTWNPRAKHYARDLLPKATRAAQNFGQFTAYDTDTNGIWTNVVVAPKPPRMRPRRSDDSAYEKRAIEPWVLSSRLKRKPVDVVAIYAKRMQIEEAFRDAKDPRYGWALDHALSRSPHRLENLILIVSLAMFAVILIGEAAELAGQSRLLQANTIRSRRVLSVFTVGCLLLKESRLRRPRPT